MTTANDVSKVNRTKDDSSTTSLQFEAYSRNLIEWLNNHCHPHTYIIIGPTSAEIVEGVRAIHTEEFLRD